MSARNFYIMQSAVAPMQSELPCYTPLTNHATDVHIVALVMASDYDQLHAANQRLEGLLRRVQVSMSLDDTEWGYSETEKYTLLTNIKAALSTANDEVTE